MVYFWLKIFHITAMTVWLTGMFFLPRIFLAKACAADGARHAHLESMGRTLYFGIMTPAGLLTIGLGVALIGFGFDGVWFPAKMVLVSLLVMIHLYHGQLMLDLTQGRVRHGRPAFHVLNWVPLVLVLAIAALTAAKPEGLPILG